MRISVRMPSTLFMHDIIGSQACSAIAIISTYSPSHNANAFWATTSIRIMNMHMCTEVATVTTLIESILNNIILCKLNKLQ